MGHHQESQLGIQDQVTIWVGSCGARAEGSGMAGLGEGRVAGPQKLHWVDSAVSPIARPQGGGGAWGRDEFTVGPGKSDTHCEVLCERERDLGLPARRPGAGRLGCVGAKRPP